MKQKSIKLLSILLALTFMVSMFAACTKKEEKKTQESKTQSTDTSGEQTQAGYVPQKKLDIAVWDTQGTDVPAVDRPKEDIAGDWLDNKTKVKIKEYYGNGGQQWEAKLTTLVASGNLPSIVKTWAGQGPAHHSKLHEGDLNWELTPDMLEKYAPEVWKSIPKYMWDSIKIDGKIYGIPYAMPVDLENDPTLPGDFLTTFSVLKEKATWTGTPSNALYIRDDILKKLIPTAMNYDEALQLLTEKNAPIGDTFILPIKSTDEYVKFMYDIKALEMKEGNRPVYATGYNGGDNWIALSVLGAEMMGYKGYYYTGWWSVPENKMKFGYLDPIFKEAAKIQNKMIRDKVIDPESLVHNAEKFKEKVMNGQYAIIPNSWIGAIDQINIDLQNAGKSFKFVPFFTQVAQREEFPAYKEGPPNFTGTLSILKTLKEDELYQVLNWVNTLFTDEWEEIRFWGTKEAGLYEELADGKRKFKDEKLHKFLVDGDMSVMDWRDAKGLNFNNTPFTGGNPGVVDNITKWLGASNFQPAYINKTAKYDTLGQAITFSADSEWVKGFVPLPNVQSWAPEYANIPEIQELWSKRATWDDPFKVAFTAKSDEDFDKKWENAIENFKKTINVDKMLEEQTKIALPLVQKRMEQAK